MQPVILSAVLASVVVLVSAASYADYTRSSGYNNNYETPTGGYDYHQTTGHDAHGGQQQQHDHHLEDEHHHHIKMIVEFPCKGPQKRLMSVKDVVPVQDTHSKTFFPDVTVLHHCDHSCGSCPQGKACAALTSTLVKRVFQVTFQEHSGLHKPGDTAFVEYELPEHTHCHCEDIHRH